MICGCRPNLGKAKYVDEDDDFEPEIWVDQDGAGTSKAMHKKPPATSSSASTKSKKRAKVSDDDEEDVYGQEEESAGEPSSEEEDRFDAEDDESVNYQ